MWKRERSPPSSEHLSYSNIKDDGKRECEEEKTTWEEKGIEREERERERKKEKEKDRERECKRDEKDRRRALLSIFLSSRLSVFVDSPLGLSHDFFSVIRSSG